MSALFEPLGLPISLARLAFFVAGKPQTAGSKSAIPSPEPGGRSLIVESGDRPAKAAWRADLRAAAGEALAAVMESGNVWPLDAPMRAEFRFMRERPAGHFGTGRNAGVLKPQFRLAYPVARPDALKLARAVEDALTKVLWLDDSQIVDEWLLKAWARPGEAAGVHVIVEALR